MSLIESEPIFNTVTAIFGDSGGGGGGGGVDDDEPFAPIEIANYC